MEKIYGYKEKDVLGLAEFISSRKGGTLSDAFNEYAQKNDKAQGTVRNLYYALAKKSNLDKEFCDKYLGGKPFAVGKIVEFDKNEEEDLIKQILKEKLNGRSVRSAIKALSGGDDKKALRYQNKFRNYIKSNPERVEEFTAELIKDNGYKNTSSQKEEIFSTQIKKLKAEINKLVEKISASEKKENEKLRAKIAYLQGENAKLRRELGLPNNPESVISYFSKKDGKRFFN